MQAQINAYAKVSSITSTTLTVSIANESYATFSAGMHVIVMQMQDNVIGTNTSDNSTFGNLSTLASAGMYEEAIIASVQRTAGNLSQITVNSPLANVYVTGANSTVQVISFPELGINGYTTTANISALDWDGDVGGVVAFRVNGTLTLNHNITADYAGFRGGESNAGDADDCNSNNYYRYEHEDYGNKGEGIYKSTNSWYAAGKGKIINGGGGGNSHNGGGGGGANFSAGGIGGKGWNCTASGGSGGVSLGTYASASRIFLGGGGGSGEGNNNFDNRGGDGGGIIIISADAIITTGSGASLRISANGGAGGDVGNDGAGAGGAGGSILLNVQNWSISSSKTLNITANGGDGGNVGDPASHGGGGGGGQGIVLFASAIPTSNINTATSFGIGGRNYSGGDRAGSGGGTNNAGILSSGAFTLLTEKIISFRAFNSNNQIHLAWEVENEAGINNYEVQRQAGDSYATIGTVRATRVKKYGFIDEQPLPGINIYRIKTTGVENAQYFSSIASVSRPDGAPFRIGIMPNPASQHATLQIFSPRAGVAGVHILNMYGSIVNKRQVSFNAGENNIMLSGLGALPAGIYQVFVSSSGEISSLRMTIRE